MYSLYDVMFGSCGPLGAGPVCYQAVSDFFNLFFLPATPEGPRALADTSSKGRLSRICKDLPLIVDCIRLTNFTALFASSISPPPLPACPKVDTGTSSPSSATSSSSFASSSSSPGTSLSCTSPSTSPPHHLSLSELSFIILITLTTIRLTKILSQPRCIRRHML